MNVAEHVTRLWLESKGFFVIGPLRVGANEIDLLAVRLGADRKSLTQKIHVEVTVSGRPGGSDDGTGVAQYIERKFGGKISSKVRELLGDDYERWVVLGKVLKGREGEWVQDGPQHGAMVIPFTRVVAEYTESISSTPADEIGRLLDTLKQLDVL